MASTSLGLEAIYPQAYTLVGVAAMLAGTCQVSSHKALLLWSWKPKGSAAQAYKPHLYPKPDQHGATSEQDAPGMQMMFLKAAHSQPTSAPMTCRCWPALTGKVQVPLTAVLLLFELTHDYFIIPPTLGAVGLAYWVASLPDTTQLLARLLPGGAPQVGGSPTVPLPAPWQSQADAQSMSRQLGMQVSPRQAEEVGPSACVRVDRQRGSPGGLCACPRARGCEQEQVYAEGGVERMWLITSFEIQNEGWRGDLKDISWGSVNRLRR